VTVARGIRSTVGRRAALALATLLVATLALAGRADAFVYWTGFISNSIGRANLDGTGVDPNFMTQVGFPNGVAVDDNFIF
jgi:hypothetical protein